MFQSCLNTSTLNPVLECFSPALTHSTSTLNPVTQLHMTGEFTKTLLNVIKKKNYMLIVILKTFLSFAPSPVLTLSVSEHLLTVKLKIDYSDYLSCSRNKIEKKIKESLKCYTQNKEKKYFTS